MPFVYIAILRTKGVFRSVNLNEVFEIRGSVRVRVAAKDLSDKSKWPSRTFAIEEGNFMELITILKLAETKKLLNEALEADKNNNVRYTLPSRRNLGPLQLPLKDFLVSEEQSSSKTQANKNLQAAAAKQRNQKIIAEHSSKRKNSSKVLNKKETSSDEPPEKKKSNEPETSPEAPQVLSDSDEILQKIREENLALKAKNVELKLTIDTLEATKEAEMTQLETNYNLELERLEKEYKNKLENLELINADLKLASDDARLKKIDENVTKLCNELLGSGSRTATTCSIDGLQNAVGEDPSAPISKNEVYIGEGRSVSKFELVKIEKKRTYSGRLESIAKQVLGAEISKFSLKGGSQKTKVTDIQMEAITNLLLALNWKKITLKGFKLGQKEVEPLSADYIRRTLGKLLSKASPAKSSGSGKECEADGSDADEEPESMGMNEGQDNDYEEGENGEEEEGRNGDEEESSGCKTSICPEYSDESD